MNGGVWHRWAALGLLLVSSAAWSAATPAEPALLPVPPAHPQDPWEHFNRRIFGFNDVVDRYAARPVAVTYQKVTPGFIRRSISRFYDNFKDLRSGVNDLLQGELGDAGRNFSRFGLNTTLGVGGLFDVATSAGVEKRPTDFGTTLAHWGVPQGPYIMLPLLGPSTPRDAAAIVPDGYFAFNSQVRHRRTYWSLWGVYMLNYRAELLDYEGVITGDRYAFIRDYYLRNRALMAGEHNVDDDFDFSSGVDSDDDDDW